MVSFFYVAFFRNIRTISLFQQLLSSPSSLFSLSLPHVSFFQRNCPESQPTFTSYPRSRLKGPTKHAFCLLAPFPFFQNGFADTSFPEYFSLFLFFFSNSEEGYFIFFFFFFFFFFFCSLATAGSAPRRPFQTTPPGPTSILRLSPFNWVFPIVSRVSRFPFCR